MGKGEGKGRCCEDQGQFKTQVTTWRNDIFLSLTCHIGSLGGRACRLLRYLRARYGVGRSDCQLLACLLDVLRNLRVLL